MSTRKTNPTRRLALLAIAFAVGALACVDGPFARINPNDAEFAGTITLTASRDTISPATPVVVLRIVTDPVVNGYEPVWYISSGAGVSNRGHGIFELVTLPLVTAPVLISATLGDSVRTITIYKSPAP